MGRRFESPLNNIKIASPCSANWDEMFGNERKRFCGECKLNVYNLSGMTKYDAENLLAASEGRLCVRYFLRSDGTVLTADCPVGWAKVKHRLSVCATAIFSMVIAVLGGLMAATLFQNHRDAVKRINVPFINPEPEPLMGAIAMPSPTPDRDPSDKPEIRRSEKVRKPEIRAHGPAKEFAKEFFGNYLFSR